MKFETELEQSNENPSDEQILEGLDSIDGNDCNFAILALDDMTYVQTAGDPSKGFALEYQNGSLEEHYRVQGQDMNLDAIKKVFLSFSKGDISLFDKYEWEKEDLSSKGGCMTVFALGITSILSYGTIDKILG
jgi:hypothetical protein